MIGSSESIVYLLFEELAETTEKIIAMSLDEEASIDILNILQTQQSTITQNIEAALMLNSNDISPVQLQQLVTKNLNLESLVKQRMLKYQSEVTAHLKGIHDGDKIKNRYQNTNIYTDGLFIDKHN